MRFNSVNMEYYYVVRDYMNARSIMTMQPRVVKSVCKKLVYGIGLLCVCVGGGGGGGRGGRGLCVHKQISMIFQTLSW